jgi:hypothetical protein
MARKDATKKRLDEAFKLVVPETVLAVVAVDDESIKLTFRWDEIDDATLGSICRGLFSLSPDASDVLLARAFAAANLNPNDPTHWRALLEFFAWAHFGSRRGPGGPKIWNAARLSQLRKDYSEINSRKRHLSDEDIFRILGKRAAYQTERGPLSTNRLRKLLKAANDPKQNELMGPLKMIEQGASTVLKTSA